MNFTPRSEKELAQANLLEKGEYPFEVIAATQERSKAGNDMIVLEVDIHTEIGTRRRLTDYIVPGTIWADKKLHDLMWSVGLGERYATGEIDHNDLTGRSGMCGVGIEKGKPFTSKVSGATLDGFDKNKVAYYKRPDAAPSSRTSPPENAAAMAAARPAPASETLDEDVPF